MSALIAAQAGAGLVQFIQGLTSGGANASSSAASNGSSGSTATSGHHHRHGGGGFEKLASAVTSALQAATANGSSDVNKTITEALTKIFKSGSLKPQGETDPTTDASESIAGTNGTGTTGTGTDNGTANALPAEFVQTLKSFGVTPQQFQSDLAAALQTAQSSGTFDPSAAFKSFPAGSVVDAVG